jgi:hypothetical protein
MRKEEKYEERLKLNETHQLLAYADDLIMLGENTNTVKKAQTLSEYRREIGLEINPENNK